MSIRKSVRLRRARLCQRIGLAALDRSASWGPPPGTDSYFRWPRQVESRGRPDICRRHSVSGPRTHARVRQATSGYVRALFSARIRPFPPPHASGCPAPRPGRGSQLASSKLPMVRKAGWFIAVTAIKSAGSSQACKPGRSVETNRPLGCQHSTAAALSCSDGTAGNPVPRRPKRSRSDPGCSCTMLRARCAHVPGRSRPTYRRRQQPPQGRKVLLRAP